MDGVLQRIIYATGCLFELARGVIVFAVVIALINVFVGTINVVSGASMEPNFHNGQYLIVDKLSYIMRQPRRGESIVLKFPGDPEKTRYIKRIIALPGEKITIRGNQTFIDNKRLPESYVPAGVLTQPDSEHVLRSEEYFMMGDNRENSNDSRVFGAVERRFIVGLAWFVLLPTKQAGLVPPQYYNLSFRGSR